ncbi:hypothetical protein ACFO9Q_00265 [Paenibacillus sp. GCM10023252]|uniref:hypothetical protein n=1 Tax=Paenibacillus sp. GCM10023252 TaxID=3252649 RepID=UPI003610CD7E
MSRRRNLTITIAIILLILAILVLGSLSPQFVIRSYMFTSLQPIHSFQSTITNLEREDPRYGHLYNATKFVDKQTGNQLEAFYLKKLGPFWRVASVGGAP